MISGKNYIGNKLSAAGNKIFKTFNPIKNMDNEWDIIEATDTEVNQAADLASKAFNIYRNVSGIEKGKFLRSIAEEIEALGEVLLDVYSAESGLPRGRALGERGRTIGQLRAFATHVEDGNWVNASIDTAQPDRQPMPKVDLRKINIPLGPVAVFGASNFPFAFSTAGGDTAAALAAGCPVIIKSHPMHAATGEMISSAIIKAAEKTGMPNGVFSNLNSSGIEVGQALVIHSKIKAVGFTGSLRGGRALFDLAAKREEPIPVFAEMGSVNPVVILPQALKNRSASLAKTYSDSITLGAGQFCTNPGLIIGIKSQYLTNFVNNLAQEIVKVDPLCMLHPRIVQAYEINKANTIAQNGIKVIASYCDDVQPNFAKQLVTTVEASIFLNNPILHHEVFGPFSLVVQCENKLQMEKVISNLDGQLTGTLISDDDEISRFSTIIDALQNRIGRIIFNGVPTGVEVCASMFHGGPYPASTDSRFTAVGVDSIKRFVRPFSYQNWPDNLLPDELKNENPLEITRLVNGHITRQKI